MLKLDTHLDTLHQIRRLNIQDFDLNKNRPELKFDIPRLNKSGVNALFMALFVKQEWGIEKGRERIDLLDSILTKLLEKNKQLYSCLSPKDISNTIINKKIAISLGIENGCVLGNDFDYLRHSYDWGVRYITLCHNFSNQICDSSTDLPVHNGLSEFGRKLVKEMNKLGMMIDISHCSDNSAHEILDRTELPIIASHSNCFSICPNSRNLSNELITRIAENKGVIQTTLLPKCVGARQDIKSFVNHIDYIKCWVGTNHIGIGSDFDGGGGINGCEDIGDMNNITIELKNRGYKKEDIEKIWGGNFMRVYSANCC